MKNLFSFARLRIAGLAAAFAVLLVAGPAAAQTPTLPIPQGMCSANQLLYAQDGNTGACTSSPSIGTSLTLGSGTAITKIAALTAAITRFTIAAQTCVVKAYTVSGLTTSDKVIVNPTYEDREASMSNFWVAAADTLEITFCNPHAQAADPEAGTVNIVAIRS